MKTAPWHDVDYFYDAAGRAVFLGEKVAYILSGSVALGEVQRIRVQRWRVDRPGPYDHHRIFVKYVKGIKRFTKEGDHVSTVTSTSNLVTLEHYKLLGGEE